MDQKWSTAKIKQSYPSFVAIIYKGEHAQTHTHAYMSEAVNTNDLGSLKSHKNT
jgi:hypothetical protein